MLLSDGPTTAEAITPYLPLIGTLAGGIVIGIFAVYNRRKGNLETRAPDVNEIWQQQAYQARELDRERRLRIRMERYADELLSVFRDFARRVLGDNPDFLMSPHERLFFDSKPPTSENTIIVDKDEK